MRSAKMLCRALMWAIAITPFRAAGSVIYNNADGVTSQPTGDQGWSVTGEFNTAGGVAIAPNYFLTAQHVGITVGQDQIFLNGVAYTSSGFTDIAGTDLRVVQISGTFPSYAQLYSGAAGTEMGKTVSIVGFGHYQLGAALTTNSVQNGWYWGSPVGMNYATNTVAAVGAFGSASYFLDIKFNAFANSGIYTFGDSGGGNFILNGGVYQLAGLTYGIQDYYIKNGDGTYTDLDNPPTNSGVAVFDAAGLYENTADSGQPPVYVPATGPEDGYATEIAPYVSQIDAITGVPEPTAALGVGALLTMSLLARRSRRDSIHHAA